MSSETLPVELDEDDPVVIADKPREPTEYEKRLRREAAKHRTDAKAARDEIERVKAAAEAEKEAIRVQARTEAEQRVIRAELKAAALKAGMVDLDGLKLLDLSSVKLNDNGEIDGADALMAAAKTSKPYLFGAVGNTSNPQTPPTPKAPEVKSAKDMTPEEYRAERAKYK
jgi:hypothetical protein